MEVIIYGAGAVGSTLGALLSERIKVTLIGEKNHVNAIIKHQLKIMGQVEKTLQIPASTAIGNIPPNTIIFLTTKIYDLEKALQILSEKVKEDTIIIPLQNGLEIKQIVQKFLPSTTILRGLTTIGSTFLEPGKVTYNDKGELFLEKTAPDELINLCKKVMPTKIIDNLPEMEWKKLIFNCITNPLTALLNIPNKELVSLTDLQKKLCKECIEVAKAEDIIFQEDLLATCNTYMAASNNLSSMLQDIMKKKKTEIDYLNGLIVEKAKKHEIPTPYNNAICLLIKARAH